MSSIGRRRASRRAATSCVAVMCLGAGVARAEGNVSVGVRASASPLTGYKTPLLWGIDASYSPLPLFAGGFEYDGTIIADAGARPEYCEGCLHWAGTGRLFGEVRPFSPYPVFPFLRGSAGIAFMEVWQSARIVKRTGAALGASAGAEGRLGPVYARVFVYATSMQNSERSRFGNNDFGGFALELGGVF
jgi:hypothetical protein